MTVDERGKKILWLAVYILWIIFDIEVAWGWDRRHLSFLGLALFGTICVSFAELPPKHAKVSSVIAILVSVLVFAFAPPTIPPPHVGWLQPANDPNPRQECLKGTKSKFMLVMGDTGFVAPDNGPVYPVVVDFCQFLRLTPTANGLGVVANIWDTDGVVVGNIRNNGFNISGEVDYITEETGDLSTIIIHDKSGHELLYVRYLNPTAVRVRGIFTCPKPRLTTTIVTNETVETPRDMSRLILGKNTCVAAAPGVEAITGIVVNSSTDKAYAGVGIAPPPNPIGGLPADPAQLPK